MQFDMRKSGKASLSQKHSNGPEGDEDETRQYVGADYPGRGNAMHKYYGRGSCPSEGAPGAEAECGRKGAMKSEM